MIFVRRVYTNRFQEVVTEEVMEVSEDYGIGEILTGGYFPIRSKGITFHREDGDSVYWERLPHGEYRSCDDCGKIEEASNFPDWIHGKCGDCDPRVNVW